MVFSAQQQRVVSGDNTVVVGGKILQIEPTRWRGTLAGYSVMVCGHLDLSGSMRYGSHVVGRYNEQGWPCLSEGKLDRRSEAVEKTLHGKAQDGFFHSAWEYRAHRGIPTFPRPHSGLSTFNRTYRVLQKAYILIC